MGFKKILPVLDGMKRHTGTDESQRGLNENNNGLLRRDGLRKSLDFRSLPDELVQAIASRRNHIPRKSLNYRTPLEVFMSHITDTQLISNLI